MCEFCTAHGEGQKWYLQIKNYTDEMLHQELSAPEKDAARATTRLEWTRRFYESFVVPAATGVPATHGYMTGRLLSEPPPEQPPEEQLVQEYKIAHFGQVLPIEDVDQVIDKVDSITRMPCGCRFINTGKTDKRYCFGLALDEWGELGKFPDAASSLEALDKDEAKDALREYDEEGLMHSIWTGVTPYVIGICNCDRDCGAYKYSIEERDTSHFFRAEYVCQTDWDLCTGCKSCMSQCQFGAQFYSSALSKVYIDPKRCFGCGVCRAACPHEAIELIPREESPEAANLWLA